MIFHDVSQGSEEWRKLRIGKVTASNYSIIMEELKTKPGEFTDKAKKYAINVALERLTGNKCDDVFVTHHMRRGVELEPVAKELYEEREFIDVSNGGFFESECGRYGDSPDGLIGKNTIEIKCPTPGIHYDNLLRGKHSPDYHWQILSHIEASGGEWCDFISYCKDFPEEAQLVVYRVFAEEYKEDMKKLQEKRDLFLNIIKGIENEIKFFRTNRAVSI